MKSLIVTRLLLMILVISSAQERTPDKARETRVRELLAKARDALGGETVLSKLQTLSVSARFSRPTKYVVVDWNEIKEKEKVRTGKMEYLYLSPDKFSRRESGSFLLTGWSYDFTEAVNGDNAWRNPPLRPPGRNNDRTVDVDEFEEFRKLQIESLQAQFSCLLTALLLRPLSSFPMEFHYAGLGEAEAEKFEALLVSNPKGFRFLLLLDPQTYRPKMIRTVLEASPGEAVYLQPFLYLTMRQRREMIARWRQEVARRRQPKKRMNLDLQFDEYRAVEGLTLPHRITTVLDGRVTEEMEIRDYKLNRSVNPKKFQEKDSSPR
jgi:hypothetical protein